jgi:hypothetical protein
MKMKRIKFKIFASGCFTALAVTLCLFTLTVISGHTQTKTSENTRDSVLRIPKPHLNGHKFITNQLVKEPFVTTNVRSTIGIGQTLDFQTPVLVINGKSLIALKGNMLFTTLDFEYQQAIRDWLAFSGRFQVAGRIGTEMQAILTSGVNVASGLELGWLVKLMETRNMALSGNIKVTSQSATMINLYDFVQGVIDSGKITPDNKIIKSSPLTRVFGGARYAYAFNKVLGANVIFEIGYGSSVDRTKGQEWVTNLGIGFDADIMPVTGVPFGFGIAYYNTNYQYSEEVIGRPQTALFQINYTGRDDFDIGLILNYQWYVESRFNNTIKFVNALLNMKYYF